MVHNPLNNSPAKEMHSFAHGSRFPALNTNTRNTSFKTFDKKSDFDKIVEKGRGKPEHAFGSRHSRFHYYPDMRNSKVGPANYKEMDAFSPKTIFQTSSKYSFGLGREEMKKEHIYAIEESERKRNVTPMPGQYDPDKSFGHTGPKYSMPGINKRSGLRVDLTHEYYLKS